MERESWRVQPTRLLACLLGGLAGATVVMVVMSWARSAFQIRTLPERIMEASLLLVSPAQFESAIELFGPAAKEYALYAATAGMVVGLVAAGAAALRLVRRPDGLVALGVALWLVVMVVIMPLTGAGFFATSLFQSPWLVNAVYLGMGFAYALALLASRAVDAILVPAGDETAEATAPTPYLGRRSMLVGIAGAAASFAVALVAGRSGGVKASDLPLASLPSPAAPNAVTLTAATTPEQAATAPGSAPVFAIPTSTPDSLPAAATVSPTLNQADSVTTTPTATLDAIPSAVANATAQPAPTANASVADGQPAPTTQPVSTVAGQPVASATPTVRQVASIDSYPVPPAARALARDKDGALLAVNRPKGQWQTPLTENNDFYVVTKNAGGDPRMEARDWRLVIDGAVNRPVQLDYLTLRRLPSVSIYKTLECISNLTSKCDLTTFGCDLISTAQWKGARLSDVLSLAGGLSPGVVVIAAIGSDEFSSALSVDAAADPNVLLVYEMNGAPLPREHGFPVRVLIPSRYGMKNTKWIVNLKAMTQTYLDWYGQRSWSQQGFVQTMSRIDVPAPGSKPPGGPQRIAGIAYGGARGISRVEFSVDGGAHWQAAMLEAPLGADTFTRWSGAFVLAAGQTATLVARATDGTGQLQTQQFNLPQPNGSTGWNSIDVSAT